MNILFLFLLYVILFVAGFATGRLIGLYTNKWLSMHKERKATT